MYDRFFFREELTVEDGELEGEFSYCMSIGDDVLFTPAPDDPLCNDELQLAAKVAWVNDDNTVNLTVFTQTGETVARRGVSQLKYGDQAPEEGHFCQDAYFTIVDQEEEFDAESFFSEDSEDED